MASTPLEVFWANEQSEKLEKVKEQITSINELIDDCLKGMIDISAMCLNYGIAAENDKNLQQSAEAFNKLINVLSDYELYLNGQKDELEGRMKKCLLMFDDGIYGYKETETEDI